MLDVRWIFLLGLAGALLTILPAFDQPLYRQQPTPGPTEQEWVDSVFATLSLEERIGQLMMIRAHSDKGPEHEAEVAQLIRDYHVGGLLFFQGDPLHQARLTNYYQQLSPNLPLLIGMDAEWGLGMRLKEHAISFPRQLMLGAIQDNRLLYDMGAEIARECRRLGVQVNLAPVVDVNNNPANPVINDRSFGEDRYNVAVKGYMYMKGLQDHQVLACAKHFPGHGDTDTDSHFDLPVILHPRDRLDSIELFPFKVLAEQGIGSMMIAHLQVPALDTTAHLPTTLSRPTVTQVLREELGFDGLIVTDGLDMQGVRKYYEPGQIEAEALLAGNDILLLPPDVPAAYRAIRDYLRRGLLTEERIDESVRKVLKEKYRLGLLHPQAIELDHLEEDLNNTAALALKRRLIENSLTLVRNGRDLLPFREVDQGTMATLAIGAPTRTPFQRMLEQYRPVSHFNVGREIPKGQYGRLVTQLADKDVVVIGLHGMNKYLDRNFGLTDSALSLIRLLGQRTKVVLVVFGNPYALGHFDEIPWLIEAYDEDEMTQELAAQGLFGAFGFRGRLPVTASSRSRFGQGIDSENLFRLGYGLPEEVGMRSEVLAQIDTIAQHAIDSSATPGCAVLVARKGKIVFQKAYGYFTYDQKRPCGVADLYDLASITKIAATTVSVMKLQEEGLIDIDQPLSKYLVELDSTNKAGLTIREMMAHHAGLRPWIPFFKRTIDQNGRPVDSLYHRQADDLFSIEVAKDLYLRKDYRDTIWQQIFQSELEKDKEYRYSDLAFFLLARLVERVSGKSLDEYAAENFYRPLGMQQTTFNPLKKFPADRIVPTEDDDYFRHQRLQGYVHDMGAAMLGGVSGHAGLFSTTADLAILMQMLLNDGYYGGRYFLQPQTVQLFKNRCDVCSRRGLGFDMKETNGKQAPNLHISPLASDHAFGHLGFTGNCVWVDPEYDLVYIFLSNRTFPKMDNYKLSQLLTRSRIHTVLYESLTFQ